MTIVGFKDLNVYQNAYGASMLVMKKIVARLSASEKYQLADQLSRSSKAIPPLIAEGFAKKHLPRSFKKYLDYAIGECNEVIVHLSYCRDLYGMQVDKKLCQELIEKYSYINKQLYKLSLVWKNFSRNY